jgi:hypothetical protein
MIEWEMKPGSAFGINAVGTGCEDRALFEWPSWAPFQHPSDGHKHNGKQSPLDDLAYLANYSCPISIGWAHKQAEMTEVVPHSHYNGRFRYRNNTRWACHDWPILRLIGEYRWLYTNSKLHHKRYGVA